jgi:hypothetical protein
MHKMAAGYSKDTLVTAYKRQGDRAKKKKAQTRHIKNP